MCKFHTVDESSDEEIPEEEIEEEEEDEEGELGGGQNESIRSSDSESVIIPATPNRPVSVMAVSIHWT